MPLHAQREAPRRVLERLRQVVDRRPARHLEARPRSRPPPDDGATWSRASAHPPRARPASPSASRTSWSPNAPGTSRWSSWPSDVRQVLDQRPAAREVHQLHPAADAEQRQVGVQRRQPERDLERVAIGHIAVVGAAGQDQPVEQIAATPTASSTSSGGSSTAQPAGALDRGRVGARQQHRLVVPHAPARALDRGAQADHRPPAHSWTPAPSSNSTVRTGPLNVCLALTSHHRPTISSTAPTVIGA